MKKIVNMKKIVKTTAKKSIKKAQNGMSTSAKRAASIASQKKNEMRDFKIEYAALNNPSDAIKADRTKKRDDVIYREPFGESPTKIKGSWKDNPNTIYGLSNPSKVGLVKKPNVAKAPVAKEKVTKRAAVGMAKANVKAVRKSFKK